MRKRIAVFILCLSISLSAWASPPLLWNQPAVEAQCPLQQQALWVNYAGGNACIRYFSAGHLTSAKNVVVVLSGDRDTLMRRDPADIPNNTVEALNLQAQKLSEKIGLPVIILARPGTYGSSGNHAKRRQRAEFMAVDAALTSLRERYGMQNFILSGHSGGATAAAAILTLGRQDIRCAILTSGAYGLLERAERLRVIRGEKSQRDKDINGLANPYDPLEHISGIVADPKRHILIIGNLQDRVTPFDLQVKFATALRAKGHWVSLIEWPAVAPQFHQLKSSPLRQNLQQCEL
ncbi:prolyl oligopeptidase family serine peptidase [Kluyvera intermedia]|uniref:alpha/beta hydrolase family protein n=1 Tax=Kluyvera intermedia TaxID=61648 RepID=UPI00093B18BB|nr:prolyl oligopeptidase family serine peptidase [Kluyvera intermedia]WQD29391.1 prolyl oligopeptidase family serine peptidase [Kluyvera intermedia]